MKKIILSAVTTAAVLLASGVAYAHCEIPCGIYGDKLRVVTLYEHAKTIEKSMKQIAALSGKSDALSTNQCVRWVNNKEKHADEVQHIVTQYFMTQRIKSPKEGDKAAHAKYVKELSCLHRMLVFAMKCKQTVDAAHVESLRKEIDGFSKSYFSKEDLEHIEKHHKGK